MSGQVIASLKTLMIFSGRAYPELADEIGKELDTELGAVSLGDFGRPIREETPALDWRERFQSAA